MAYGRDRQEDGRASFWHERAVAICEHVGFGQALGEPKLTALVAVMDELPGVHVAIEPADCPSRVSGLPRGAGTTSKWRASRNVAAHKHF